MNTTNSIIPIWQPQGYSTNHLAKKIGELYGVKSTHTGTLDPMAEGVVIVLTDENRLKRQELSSLVKGYEFEILFGLKTDSFDGMGILDTNSIGSNNLSFLVDKISINKENLKVVCNAFIGEYSQQVPLFSAQLYKGKKLFEWGHLKENVPLPTKKGTIYKLEVLDVYELSFTDAVDSIITRLKNITGDFRQQEIIEQWENIKTSVLNKNTNVSGFEKVTIAKFYIENSRGLYIRSLSQDICEKLGTVGFIYSLVRTRNGDYFKKDCISLVTLFNENYDTILRS